MISGDLFRRISSLLEHAATPYMLTGSFASSVYGIHRGSPNINFIIAADETGIRRLLDRLPQLDFYSDLGHALDACRDGSMFCVIDHVTGLKIDFIFLKNREFSQEEFGRRNKGVSVGHLALIATPEDVVIEKLEWEKLGKSSRQIQDAAGILKVRGAELDFSYIQKWVQELGLVSQWSQARRLRTWISNSHKVKTNSNQNLQFPRPEAYLMM
jgi:hypothetical protein